MVVLRLFDQRLLWLARPLGTLESGLKNITLAAYAGWPQSYHCPITGQLGERAFAVAASVSPAGCITARRNHTNLENAGHCLFQRRMSVPAPRCGCYSACPRRPGCGDSSNLPNNVTFEPGSLALLKYPPDSGAQRHQRARLSAEADREGRTPALPGGFTPLQVPGTDSQRAGADFGDAVRALFL